MPYCHLLPFTESHQWEQHTRHYDFASAEWEEWYAEMLAQVHKNPGCIGFHLCGAYQRNRVRRYGLLDEAEQPDEENVALISAANEQIGQMNATFGSARS